MDFITIAKQRMSVRDYKETKVEPEKLEQILEAAHVAPTAANLQPIRLIAVQSEEGLAKISKAANIYGAPLAIIVCADHDNIFFQTGKTAQILRDQHTPLLVRRQNACPGKEPAPDLSAFGLRDRCNLCRKALPLRLGIDRQTGLIQSFCHIKCCP